MEEWTGTCLRRSTRTFPLEFDFNVRVSMAFGLHIPWSFLVWMVWLVKLEEDKIPELTRKVSRSLSSQLLKLSTRKSSWILIKNLEFPFSVIVDQTHSKNHFVSNKVSSLFRSPRSPRLESFQMQLLTFPLRHLQILISQPFQKWLSSAYCIVRHRFGRRFDIIATKTVSATRLGRHVAGVRLGGR